MTTFSIVNSNICCNPKRFQWQVRRRINQAAKIPGIHTGSEIEIPRYWRAWERIMRRHGMLSFGIGREVPISLNPHVFDVTDHHLRRIHGGREGVSPSRYVNEVLSRHLDGLLVGALAAHPASWGYPAARHKAGRSYEWRRARLLEYEKWLTMRTAALVAQGYTVVISGDMNNPTPPKFHPAQVHVAHSGLDHIWVVPAAGYRVKAHRQKSIPANRRLGMDHPIITATVEIERAA